MKLPNSIKLLLSVLVSGLFLFLIYRKVEFDSLRETLATANQKYFWIYISLFLPQLALAVFRWKYILGKINNYPVTLYHAFQMVVGSYSANLVIPAKMGEVVRVFWVDKNRSKYKPIIVILFEKIWDLLAVYILAYFALFFLVKAYPQYTVISSYASLANFLAIILLAGILIFWFRKGFRPESKFSQRISGLIVFIIENRGKLLQTALWSLALWSIQLLQFYFMFRVFDVEIGLAHAFAGGGLGVLAGAVIVSIGGVGPRDAALIWFFAGIVPREILVSVGIISIFRIIVPALIGMPFFINLSFRRKAWNKNSGKI